MEEYEVPAGFKSGFVAVVGRPNVGKSTLMNAFLGEKVAIVSPKPQTTRQRQLGILTTEVYQIVFMDTPGIMLPQHKLDEFMVDTAVETLNDADVILWLVDASEPVGAGDRAIAARLEASPTPSILAMNKADLLPAAEVLPRTEAYRALLPAAEWILFSAQNGRGRDELLDMIVNALPEGPRYYPEDQVTDSYVRDMAAEFIREQIMRQLRDEVPYGTAVQILEFKERDSGDVYISANIFVDRDTHKRIIIGKKGQQLKEIGAAARAQLEELVGGKVFLELWVKVEPKWRQNEKWLKRLGYVKQE
ncbi:MAG TPA: GTPase Era [Chloroflexota bacterium]|nr:GTPase Era [Chloroflexota bacterium]HUM69238.1 GTPase Era [Chloroflexota bacterium]